MTFAKTVNLRYLRIVESRVLLLRFESVFMRLTRFLSLNLKNFFWDFDVSRRKHIVFFSFTALNKWISTKQ
jgi:hypothetical protein